ncbi:hypothetical protein HS7_12240 [Sulfolobales archaeon HS-7]|nr:hypothetical protein HS7_12240 [Sulfolobales archaeon HS-7]
MKSREVDIGIDCFFNHLIRNAGEYHELQKTKSLLTFVSDVNEKPLFLLLTLEKVLNTAKFYLA